MASTRVVSWRQHWRERRQRASAQITGAEEMERCGERRVFLECSAHAPGTSTGDMVTEPAEVGASILSMPSLAGAPRCLDVTNWITASHI